MTFSRNFMEQKAFPFMAIAIPLSLLVALLLPAPPEFKFCYGLWGPLLSVVFLVKACWAAKKTDFTYTISYGCKYLTIKKAGGQTDVYRLDSLRPGINATHFWLEDGENKRTYLYNDEVIKFLDRLE